MIRDYSSCVAVRSYLNAFADGELRGEVWRGVSQHVEHCSACAESVGAIGELGKVLRSGLTLEAEPPDLAGLADGVVSRIRAEDHESWRGMFERATEDLHWVFVGVGSVAAAFMSALVVSVVVQSGVGQRADSLAAMLNQMAAAPPALGRSVGVSADLPAPGFDDVRLASLTEMNDEGHASNRTLLSRMDARDAAILLAELRRMGFGQQQDRWMTDPTGRQVVLFFSATEVRGKKKIL